MSVHTRWARFGALALLYSTTLVAGGPTDPDTGPVVVATWQLEDLRTIIERLHAALRTATLATNNAEVIPRQKDRDAFVADMESVRRVANGRNGFEQWLDDVKRQTPLPNDTRKYYLRDFQVVGFGPNDDAAAEDLRKECKALEALMKDAYETGFAGVICGSGWQKVTLDGGKTIALSNRAVVVVRVPKTASVELRNGDWITSGNVEIGVRNYRSWQENCKGWLYEQFNTHGEKLVGASCGAIDSLSSYNYQSQGRIVLRK